MKKYLIRYAKNFDYTLFITVLLLALFGLVMIYSSSIMTALVDDKAPDYYYILQLRNMKVAAIGFLVAAFFPYKHYGNKIFMVSSLFVLILLYILLFTVGYGRDTVGSQSWVQLFGMNFQPSEYAKLFIILYFAAAFYRKGLKTSNNDLQPDDIVYPIIVWLIIIGLVGLETDLGAVVIISGIAVAVLLASGIRFKTFTKFFAVLAVFGSLLFAILLFFKKDILTESRIGRFTSFMNPFDYAEGSGHQVINGYLAIGSGGIQGLGLGQSVQKLGYLPEPQTDFILAIILEELGLLGVFIVLGGLGFLVYKGLSIALSTNDPLARMIATGIASWVAIQSIVNIGGLSGLMPLTGVTLPFISYGGTSIILLSLAMGILVNISMFVKIEKNKRNKGDY